MKRAMTLGLGALALAGMTLPTLAADMPTKAPVVPPVIPYSWTGFYIGGNIGAKWGDFTGAETVAGFVAPAGVLFFGNNNNNNNVEFMGGGQIGYNWQFTQWVFGLEGDIDATNLRRTFICCGPFVPAPFLLGDAFTLHNDWQASIRGRVGYALDRFLVYATGGVAFANLKATANFLPVGILPGLIVSDSRTLTGFTIGAGFEYGIWDNWSVGVEYRFSDFGNDNFGLGALALTPVVTAAVTSNNSLQTNEVTARLNYRFNWGAAPVAARY